MLYLYILLSVVLQSPSHWNVNESGVALSGYDPVSYFDSKPRLGKPELAYQYESAIFYFSTISNLEKFQVSPESYLPAFGGFCVYEMGISGDKRAVNPTAYMIVNERLLLFGSNTLNRWNESQSLLIKKANKNWNKVIRSSN